MEHHKFSASGTFSLHPECGQGQLLPMQLPQQEGKTRLTEAQQARIMHNLRAAKAILAKKQPAVTETETGPPDFLQPDRPVSPANRKRAALSASMNGRTSSFKRPVDSPHRLNGPSEFALKELPANCLRASPHFPLKENQGPRTVWTGVVNGRKADVHTSETLQQPHGFQLLKGNSYPGTEPSVPGWLAGSGSQYETVVRDGILDATVWKSDESATCRDMDQAGLLPRGQGDKETLGKTHLPESSNLGIHVDDAVIVATARACDVGLQAPGSDCMTLSTEYSTAGCGRESTMLAPPQALSPEFDENSLLEIDRLCAERASMSAAAGSFTDCGNDEGEDQGKRSFAGGVEALNDLTPASVVRPEPLGVSSELPVLSSAETGTVKLPGYICKLNESQKKAALSDSSRPLLILAGPGSGKTSTMVARLLTILGDGVQPKNILAMTFTTAAATEMRERVGVLIGKAASKELSICTFHSFCLQLCRAHADKLGRTADFVIYGHGQQRRAVIEATRLALSKNVAASHLVEDRQDTSDNMVESGPGLAIWKEKARKWQKFVTQAKAAGKTSNDYEKIGNHIGADILKHYEAALATCNALDYHDFISFAVKLLEAHPEVLDECHKSWTYLLVDEFQDTSAMQYDFLRLIASHKRVTVVGDDDQSIFSFNGANLTGFERFRKDFSDHNEVRLHQNYRSTRCIVEAAHSVIRNNINRCATKQAFTENVGGDKIVVRECRTEASQCAYVVDNILMDVSTTSTSYSNSAILYRRQVTGKAIQAALCARKVPFNVHGVAFYRKKVIKNVVSLLQLVLPGSKDLVGRRVFKALYPSDKAETKRVVEYVDKVATVNKTPFWQAAETIFSAKISGTFSRHQLALGRKVLSCVLMMKRLVYKEQSLSALVTAAINLLPQRHAFESRAIVDENGGKLLNEDYDSRTIMDYFRDDVNDFLRDHYDPMPAVSIESGEGPSETGKEKGCVRVVTAFLDHIGAREAENYRLRRAENKNSITLTTMHQSKGLEWDTVYIVKANDSETPLLHEAVGCAGDDGAGSLEEERRLFYVAMTRARKKLYICYVLLDTQRQLLQPSRFLKEIPAALLKIERYDDNCQITRSESHSELGHCNPEASEAAQARPSGVDLAAKGELEGLSYAGTFLKGFSMDSRSTVAGLFHTWAKKPAFQDPSRLLDKVGFVIDERLRAKATKNRDLLHALKASLKDKEALAYAVHVINWTKVPVEDRVLLQAERQEHFQQMGTERAMSSSAATPKQKAYLRSLGCTLEPNSRLHASELIEQYKKL